MSKINKLIVQELNKIKSRKQTAAFENSIRPLIKETFDEMVKENYVKSKDIGSKLETMRKKLISDGKINIHEKGSATNNYGARPERRIPLETVASLSDIPVNELILFFLNGHRVHEGRELVEYRLGHVYFYGEMTEVPSKMVKESYDKNPSKKEKEDLDNEKPTGMAGLKDPYGTGSVVPKKSDKLKKIKKDPYESTINDVSYDDSGRRIGYRAPRPPDEDEPPSYRPGTRGPNGAIIPKSPRFGTPKKAPEPPKKEGKSNPSTTKNLYKTATKINKVTAQDPHMSPIHKRDMDRMSNFVKPITGKDIGLDYTRDKEPTDAYRANIRKKTPAYSRNEPPKDPGLRNIAKKNAPLEGKSNPSPEKDAYKMAKGIDKMADQNKDSGITYRALKKSADSIRPRTVANPFKKEGKSNPSPEKDAYKMAKDIDKMADQNKDSGILYRGLKKSADSIRPRTVANPFKSSPKKEGKSNPLPAKDDYKAARQLQKSSDRIDTKYPVAKNFLSRKAKEMMPRTVKEDGSEAGEEAKRLGLIAKPYGNYADPRTGQVTHKSVNGKLTAVGDEAPQAATPAAPKAYNQMKPGVDYGKETIPADDTDGPVRLANLLRKGQNITVEPSKTAGSSYDGNYSVGDTYNNDFQIADFNDDGTEALITGGPENDQEFWVDVDQLDPELINPADWTKNQAAKKSGVKNLDVYHEPRGFSDLPIGNAEDEEDPYDQPLEDDGGLPREVPAGHPGYQKYLRSLKLR